MKHSQFIHGLLLAVTLVSLPGCSWFSSKTEKAPGEASLRIIDVNTQEVFNDAHIKGALHSDLDSVEQLVQNWDKKTPVVFYCSDFLCGASHSAAEKVRKLGFENVVVYPGGIHEWYSLAKKDPNMYPLEGKAEMEFLRKEVLGVPTKEDANVVSADELAQRLNK